MRYLILIGAWLVLGSACTRNVTGQKPLGSFHFPTSMALSPSGDILYVVNSNFDKRFSSGWVSVVDLRQLIQDGAQESDWLLSRLNVPDLGGTIAVNATGTRAAIAHRGTPMVSLIEIDGTTLSCGDAGSTSSLSTALQQSDCDKYHFLEIAGGAYGATSTAADLIAPFALSWVNADISGTPTSLLALGFLDSAWLAFYEENASANPRLKLHGTAQEIGKSGIGQLIVHPDASGNFLAGLSQAISSDGVQSSVYDIDIERQLAKAHNAVALHDIHAAAGGSELNQMVFSPDGSRAYVTSRSTPDSIVSLNSTVRLLPDLQSDGTVSLYARPAYDVVGAFPLKGRPTGLTYIPKGSGDLLVATAFEDDKTFILSPEADTLSVVRELDDVGNGPFALTSTTVDGRDLVIVAAFYDHSLAVYDVTSSSPADFKLLVKVRNEKISAEKSVP